MKIFGALSLTRAKATRSLHYIIGQLVRYSNMRTFAYAVLIRITDNCQKMQQNNTLGIASHGMIRAKVMPEAPHILSTTQLLPSRIKASALVVSCNVICRTRR